MSRTVITLITVMCRAAGGAQGEAPEFPCVHPVMCQVPGAQRCEKTRRGQAFSVDLGPAYVSPGMFPQGSPYPDRRTPGTGHRIPASSQLSIPPGGLHLAQQHHRELRAGRGLRTRRPLHRLHGLSRPVRPQPPLLARSAAAFRPLPRRRPGALRPHGLGHRSGRPAVAVRGRRGTAAGRSGTAGGGRYRGGPRGGAAAPGARP